MSGPTCLFRSKIAKFALYAFATAVTMGIIYLTHWCVEFLR